jgi:hypothetical protein
VWVSEAGTSVQHAHMKHVCKLETTAGLFVEGLMGRPTRDLSEQWLPSSANNHSNRPTYCTGPWHCSKAVMLSSKAFYGLAMTLGTYKSQ